MYVSYIVEYINVHRSLCMCHIFLTDYKKSRKSRDRFTKSPCTEWHQKMYTNFIHFSCQMYIHILGHSVHNFWKKSSRCVLILYIHFIIYISVNLLTYLLTYLITYLLTPRCRVLLEKLTGLQLVKKFPAFHRIRRFITALTSVRQLSLSWASPIQSI